MSNREVVIGVRVYTVILTIKKIKNSYLRVGENGEVLISSRKNMSDKEIINFITRSKEKVDKAIDKKILDKKNKLLSITLFDRPYTLNFARGNGYKIGTDSILINSRSDSEVALETFKMKFAKEKLPNIFYEVVSDLNLKISEPSLQIRKMKTRWGVCHVTKNKVVLNSELIKYSSEVVRYVIIHELMHFFQPNHSREFWNLVENFVPDHKAIRQKLKNS